MAKRRQCAKCPWKKSTNPHDIPGGYCEIKHANLKSTIADQSDPISQIMGGELRMMACHEFPEGREEPCVGWVAHQLGPGNNIALRLAARSGRVPVDFDLVGEQHERFEDTLPDRDDG